MIFQRRTYQDVAKEISDGLMSGDVVLESEPAQGEMGLLAALVFQHLTPRKVAYTIGAARSMGGVLSKPSQVMFQIDPKEYENLPEDVKARFSIKTRELTQRGVKVIIRDLKGRVIAISGFAGPTMSAHVDVVRGPASHSSSEN